MTDKKRSISINRTFSVMAAFIVITACQINPVKAGSNIYEFREILSLNGSWKYAVDPQGDGLAAGWAQTGINPLGTIPIPGAIQSVDALIEAYPPDRETSGYRNSYASDWWAERSFHLDSLIPGRLALLVIGGIAPAAYIYINGFLVHRHDTPQVETTIEITNFVRPGLNTISIMLLEQNITHMGGMRFGSSRWSGIYREIKIVQVNSCYIKHVTVQTDLENEEVVFSGEIENSGKSEVRAMAKAMISEWEQQSKNGEANSKPINIHTNGTAKFQIRVKMRAPRPWHTTDPFLYTGHIELAIEEEVVDRLELRFGMRSFTGSGQDLLLNDKPLFLAGVGQEYFSPTISPLIDKEIIRQRIRSLKAYGFNFFRCHTYPALPEVLDVADEEGFLFCSEISVVSNFNKTTPFELGLKMFETHILQSRHHPSLIIYSLGNEGIQKLVNEEKTRIESQIAYEMIKTKAPNQLAMIAFGNQGERPDLKNDILSPHLWSDAFTWAYDGLSRVPWHTITNLTTSEPCIVHEFGKFGLWPDVKEARLYPKRGFDLHKYAKDARLALEKQGLVHLEDRIIENSRRSFSAYSRLVMEESRKQPDIDGYTMWTAFRGGKRNSGFADDMGITCNADTSLYKNGCNAPVAILIDRGIDQRLLIAEMENKVSFYVSNFGAESLENAVIKWSMVTPEGEDIYSDESSGISCPLGRSRQVMTVLIPLLSQRTPLKVQLKASLYDKGKMLSSNYWDFWIFSSFHKLHNESKVLCYLKDEEFSRRLRLNYPSIIRLKDAASMQDGCLVWQGVRISKTVEIYDTEVLVADHWSDSIASLAEMGINVLILDNGNLPGPWYTPNWSNRFSKFDRSTSYTSFRSGWDEGNLTRIIQPHPVMDVFPHDGFCNFHFFNLVQYAKPLRTYEVQRGLSGQDPEVIIYNIPKIKPNEKANYEIDTENQHYLMEVKKGKGRVLVCSFRMMEDIAGKQFLKNLISYLQTPDHNQN